VAKPAALQGIEDPFAPPPRRGPKQIETVAEVQAAVQGVPSGNTIEWMGETYKVADKVGHAAYLRFGWLASHGADLENMEALAASWDMLRDVFVIRHACGKCDACQAKETCPREDLGDWPRFQDDAYRNKADTEEIMEAITSAMEIITARPTRRPSDSSAGPSTTSTNSTGSSSSPASRTGRVVEVPANQLTG
jgi:hypothetical protein